jgi:hypothetical protein
MGTKRHMFFSSLCFIEPCSSHCPFVLSCVITDLFFISSPMQTTNHPLVPPPPFNKPHTTYSSPYWPLILRVNVRFQPYTFLNPLDHVRVRPFPLSILLTPIVVHDQAPQPTPISSTRLQLSLKVSCPSFGAQFANQRLVRHQRSYQTFNSFNLNPCDHPNSMPSLVPIQLTSAWTWVSSLDVLRSFHLGFCRLQLYNYIPTVLWYDV